MASNKARVKTCGRSINILKKTSGIEKKKNIVQRNGQRIASFLNTK